MRHFFSWVHFYEFKKNMRLNGAKEGQEANIHNKYCIFRFLCVNGDIKLLDFAQKWII